jgi:hypothetical protein
MKKQVILIPVAWILVGTQALFAQAGEAGITAATDQVRSFFGSGVLLMYAIGGIVGLVGQLRSLISGMPVNRTREKWQLPGLAPAFFW